MKKIKGFPLKVKSFQNTAKYPKLRGGVPSTPPPPCTTVGVWICLYVRWLTLIVWPRSVVTLRVLSSGSVLVLHNSKRLLTILNSFHRAQYFPSRYCHWQKAVPNCLACEYSRFLFIHFPHSEWMFPPNVSGGGCIRRLRIIGRSEKLRRIDWWQVSVLQDNPLSVLFF